MRTDKFSVSIEDVGGSFQRLYRDSPKIARKLLQPAVRLSAFSLGRRMEALAPRSDPTFAPHIQDQIDTKAHGLSARVGILDPGPTGIEADIALFNEYRPNKQPFMRPAAEAHEKEHARILERALRGLPSRITGSSGGAL
jgi:hypothetical protein